MKTKTEIVVNLQYEGVHRWPECDIQKVGYLKYPHRHLFHIKAKKAVSHGDREIEVICFKHEITKYLNEIYGGHFGDKSCEMIAKELVEIFELTECQVLEDGENGAIVYAI